MNFWNKLRAATSSSSLATSGGSSSGGKRSKPPRHAESEPNITSTHPEKKPDKKVTIIILHFGTLIFLSFCFFS